MTASAPTIPIWAAQDPNAGSWAELLSRSPLIIHGWPSAGLPLGAASALGPLLRDRAVHFLLTPSWSLEAPWYGDRVAQAASAYLVDHPRHRLTLLCNASREAELMRAAGLTADTVNHNCLMNEAIYKPIPGIAPAYDAVCNARLTPDKRPELAREIDRLALIYYNFDPVPEFHALHARLRALMPKASFINELTPSGCDWLSGPAVNEVYARSRIGLCLSAIEGAMRASIEYLFAGLSVVSTPSLGGRDVYFDDEFCIIAEPDPRAIRNAVDALVARNVPRDYVRAKTMARVEQDRQRYIRLVQGLIDKAGGTFNFEPHFWQCTRGATIMRWRAMSEFAETVTGRVNDPT